MLKFLVLTYLTLTFLIADIKAQGFKEIEPIHSNCEDVEKILKIKACSLSRVNFETDNQEIDIFISNDKCEETVSGRYNVPVGTILGVRVVYKDSALLPKLEEFTQDLTGFKKSQDDISYFYFNFEKGVEYMVTPDHWVRVIYYFPSQTYKHLLCKKQ